MVSQVKEPSWSSSSWNKKVIVFLALFIAYEVGFTVVAKPAARKVTILNKAGRYLTIGQQGITGKYVNSPYGKIIYRTSRLNSFAHFGRTFRTSENFSGRCTMDC